MNKMIKKNKKMMIGGLILLFGLLAIIVYFYFFDKKEVIKFNEKYLSIEYGETLDYEKAIESLNPKSAKVEFPDVEVKEVGTYELTFKYTINGRERKQKQNFIVKDTKLPNVKVKNDKTVEVLINSQYDIFTNVIEYKNLSEEAKQNRQLLSEDEYKKVKKQIKEQRDLIAERTITSNDDIKESAIAKNCIVYFTDYDMNKEGTYQVKMLFIDENYNIDEENWKIKVMPSGQIVNSGGTVSCVYPNESLQSNEAFITDYTEIYKYNEDKLVTSLNFMTKMTFKEDYDTNENISSLINAINSKYAGYMDHQGIAVSVESNNGEVVTNIIVDFNSYDSKSDPLNLLESKNAGKVKIETVVDKLKEKATCSIY